jgi:D-alanyl-D-alanine endopeptidase (penicillin-binding protein 7)
VHFTSTANPPPSDLSSTPAPLGPEAQPGTVSYVKASEIVQYGNPNRLSMRSDVALVMDDREGVLLYGRHIDEQRPIASLTKLMTALIIIESKLPLDEPIEITRDDRDRLRGSHSRLPFGATFTRYDLLRAALGASDNRAAAALGRTYPGGTPAFVAAMNAKAHALGMAHTRYADSSGLDSNNVSTARDLVQLVAAVRQYPLFRTLTTTGTFRITDLAKNRDVAFHNTNRLVRQSRWDIGLSKTGYTTDAGPCLLMQATIGDRPVTIVLLDSWGRMSRYGDAERIRNWITNAERRVQLTTASAHDS